MNEKEKEEWNYSMTKVIFKSYSNEKKIAIFKGYFYLCHAKTLKGYELVDDKNLADLKCIKTILQEDNITCEEMNILTLNNPKL